MNRFLAVALVLVSVSGCVTYGRKLNQESVAKIKKGETTKEEVLKLLGSPDQLTSTGNGDTSFHYMFVRATPKAASFIPIVGAFAGGANVQNQMVLVSFSSANVVSNIMTSYGGTETGIGASAASKADLKDVEKNKRPQ